MKRHAPIGLAIAVYWVATAALIVMSMRRTGGRLVYPLDDAYVHMAIARSVAVDHVWGVTRYAFTSSTSSPLWTVLLALTYSVSGVGAVAPLVFNLAAGTLIVATVGVIMRDRAAGPVLTGAVLMAAVFVAPLPTLTLIGMEHTPHALITLWFTFAAASLLASNRPVEPWRLAIAGLLAALATALRYEGMFVVCVVALLFAAARRWREAAVAGAAGAAPIAVYGLWSFVHGWHVLPNSVLLKGQTPTPGLKAMLAFAAGSPALHSLLANPPMLLLVVAALALLLVVTRAAVWNEDVFLLAILIGTSLLHMQLARVGWFYRYEAYLLVLGVAVFGVIAADRLMPFREWARGGAGWTRAAVAVALVAVAGFPFLSRGLNAMRNTPAASENIYSQQYQMGLFADRFYHGRMIAVNDVGAVAYLADVRLLDLFGLATLDVADMKRDGRYRSQAIASLAERQGAGVAMIYQSWLNEYGGVPGGWTKVGEWRVRDNVVLGENAVSFYAVRDEERRPLAEHLRRFAPDLPPGVTQAGEYLR